MSSATCTTSTSVGALLHHIMYNSTRHSHRLPLEQTDRSSVQDYRPRVPRNQFCVVRPRVQRGPHHAGAVSGLLRPRIQVRPPIRPARPRHRRPLHGLHSLRDTVEDSVPGQHEQGASYFLSAPLTTILLG